MDYPTTLMPSLGKNLMGLKALIREVVQILSSEPRNKISFNIIKIHIIIFSTVEYKVQY